MTDAEKTAEKPKTATIPFHGRRIKIKVPEPEQVMVWKRIVSRLSDMSGDAGMTGEAAIVALERARKIIDSLIFNREDIDWLDDQMLEGSIDLEEAFKFVTKAAKVFAKDLADSSTTPPSSARRKKPKPREQEG